MNKTIPITAAVLAAGKSSRMGCSKVLLPVGGTPMLEVTLRKLLALAFQKIICITGHWDMEIRSAISIDDPRLAWIYNPDYAEGQSASLRIAAQACPDDARGMLVFLADQPFIKPETIGRVLTEALQGDVPLDVKTVVQPAFNGQKGHPVYFSRPMLAHFSELAGDIGAKPVIRHADRHILVPVEDEGVILDLDTPEEYEMHADTQPPR